VAIAVGTQLGPFEILSPLGAGGMGEVYRARDSRLGREVAIKVLPVAFSADEDRLRRFEQEARATSALNNRGQFLNENKLPRFVARCCVRNHAVYGSG